MIDEKKRNKGKYKETFSKIIDGKRVQITEETTIGRNFEILGFSRGYNPPIIYKSNS